MFCVADSVISGAFMLAAHIFVHKKKKLQLLCWNMRRQKNPEFVHPLTLPFMPRHHHHHHPVRENRDIKTNCMSFRMLQCAVIVLRKKEGADFDFKLSPFCECGVFFLFGDSPAAEFYVLTFRNSQFHLHRLCEQGSCSHDLWRHIKFRCQGVARKKEYDNGRFIRELLPALSCVCVLYCI